MATLIARLKSLFEGWMAAPMPLTPRHGWLLPAPALARSQRGAPGHASRVR